MKWAAEFVAISSIAAISAVLCRSTSSFHSNHFVFAQHIVGVVPVKFAKRLAKHRTRACKSPRSGSISKMRSQVCVDQVLVAIP